MKGKNLFRNSIAILIVVIAVIVGATGCGSDTSSKTTSGTKVIRIGTTGQDSESSLLDNAQYSYKLGYLQDKLKKEGYTVELKGFAQALLALGDADAVVSTVSNLAVFENDGLGNIIIDSSNGSSLSSGFLFAGRSQWLKENPKAAIAISKALICSQEEAEESPTDVYKN